MLVWVLLAFQGSNGQAVSDRGGTSMVLVFILQVAQEIIDDTIPQSRTAYSIYSLTGTPGSSQVPTQPVF